MRDITIHRRSYRGLLGLLAVTAMLSACAEIPDNPSVDVMPPLGKPWQAFAGEREFCKKQAAERVAHTVDRANTTGIIGGVASTVLGAGIGAAAGGGAGAGIGAATGALAGTAGGGLYSGSANGSIQNAYNIGYLQCMGTYGNIVPHHAPGGPPVYDAPGYGNQGYGQNPAGYGQPVPGRWSQRMNSIPRGPNGYPLGYIPYSQNNAPGAPVSYTSNTFGDTSGG